MSGFGWRRSEQHLCQPFPKRPVVLEAPLAAHGVPAAQWFLQLLHARLGGAMLSLGAVAQCSFSAGTGDDMKNLLLGLVAGAAMIVRDGAPSNADSRLPQNDPGAAIDLGDIDSVQSIPGRSDKHMLCIRYQTTIKVNDPYISAAWYKFKVSRNDSVVYVKMTETPQQTLFFELFDGANGPQNLNFIRRFRGALNEEINERFAAGLYYLKVLSESGSNTNPNGTNIGNILFRGFPKLYVYPPPSPNSGPINLGVLTPGSTITRDDIVLYVAGRGTNFTPDANNRHCSQSGSDGMVLRPSQEYVVPNVPAGPVNIGISQQSGSNWNLGPFGAHVPAQLGGWTAVQGGFVQHRGGNLRILVGVTSPHTIYPEDFFMNYRLQVSR